MWPAVEYLLPLFKKLLFLCAWSLPAREDQRGHV